MFVMAITSNHGFGNEDSDITTAPVGLVGESAVVSAEVLVNGIRMFRTEMLRTSRANHFASNEELDELIRINRVG